MDKKAFILELEKSNGYCSCPNLQQLYQVLREVRKKRESCAFFARNNDLGTITAKDTQFVLDYQTATQEFKSALQPYNLELNRQAVEHRLAFVRHDIKCGTKKPIKLEEVAKIQKENESVLTINCANCNQQVEIL